MDVICIAQTALAAKFFSGAAATRFQGLGFLVLSRICCGHLNYLFYADMAFVRISQQFPLIYLLYSFFQSSQADASLCGSKFGSPEIGGFQSLKNISQDLPRLR